MLRPLMDLQREIRALERTLALNGDLELEAGLDLLDVWGRGRQRLRERLAALHHELAWRQRGA